MTTFRLSLGPLLIPDTSGNVFWQPASILDTNDLYPTNQVLCFVDTATKDGASCSFLVPKNYLGSAKLIARYKTTATSGNAQWAVDYTAVAVGESADPAAHQESLGGSAAAVPGTANQIAEQTLTLTAANLAVDDTVLVTVSRRGDGSDTVAATLQLLDLIFEWTDV